MTIGEDVKLHYANENEKPQENNGFVFNENYLKMLEDLSKNSRIVFVSQNIDDPDLDEKDKSKIADEIFQESQLKFINRFGKFLSLDHLKIFENSQNDEIDFMIKELETNLINRHKNIRNRRYYALKNMIAKNDYFSETEMMKRDPLLYEELIGQYLSASEKKYDAKNKLLSEILLDQMDKDLMELKKQQESDENNISIDSEDNSNDSNNDSNKISYQMESEQSCTGAELCLHKKWGEFEDSVNENIEIKPINHLNQIQLQQREMLRQEFTSIMHNRFLNGEDKNFDYTEIDENSMNDDLKIQQQDLEDKYFDESSSDDEIVQNEYINDDEEDDLDIFMKHLNENSSAENEEDEN